MNREDEPVIIYKALNKVKAQAAREVLESHGIPCQMEPLKLWLSPGSSLVNRGEINILVPESQAESAMKLLKRRRYAQVYKRSF